jgi:hypothetical protein
MAMADGPMLKIDADGEIVQCAKGLDSSECGYKAGDKVCGKCGAMAVSMKMMDDMAMEMDEDMPAPMPKKKKKPMMEMEMVEEKAAMRAYGDVYQDEEHDVQENDEEDMDEEDEMPGEEKMYGMMPKKKKRMEMMDDEDMDMDEEDMDMEDEDMEDDDMDEMLAMRSAPKRKRQMVPVAEEELVDEEELDDEMSEQEDEVPNRQMMENRRLRSMGYKSEDFGSDVFVCAIERKVYPGSTGLCDNCPGGCVKEGDMPALLEIEGRAEDMFSGKVLDSGYSDVADMFVVDVERKDGKPIEIFFDGSSGEVMGWHMLNEEVLQVKSGFQPTNLISFSDAAGIATKSIQGDVVAVEADIFEGFDAYAVEIEGIDGKSYDVFVSLDGDVLGYDEYTQDEALAIEAEAAEIALKRSYSDIQKKEMAEAGEAMDDGNFPIANETDLRNAIMAWERSKSDVAKMHIMKRAMALGLENIIPDGWVDEETKKRFETGEKSAADNFLSTLLEFEMISAEEGFSISQDESKPQTELS